MKFAYVRFDDGKVFIINDPQITVNPGQSLSGDLRGYQGSESNPPGEPEEIPKDTWVDGRAEHTLKFKNQVNERFAIEPFWLLGVRYIVTEYNNATYEVTAKGYG